MLSQHQQHQHQHQQLPVRPEAEGRKRKRLKVNSACDACRDRKTRCDGRRPVCLACENRGCGHSCQYTRAQRGGTDAHVELAEAAEADADANANANANANINIKVNANANTTTTTNTNTNSIAIAIANANTNANTNHIFNAHSSVASSINSIPPNVFPASSVSTQSPPPRTSASTWEESPATESDGLATLTSYDDNSTYGSSSTVAFFRRILSADDAIKSAVRLERMEDPQPRPKPLPLGVSDGAVLILPRRRDADKFVLSYWDFIHPMFPILHKPTFFEKYNQFWIAETECHRDSCSKSTREHSVFVSMLNIVCALGCQFTDLIRDAHKTAVAYEFYERSQQSFSHDWLDSADLSLVQLLLLNGVYLQSTQHANRCWNSIGLAIRVSQILGLHVEAQKSAISPLDRQMRRRIWHTCVSLDRLLSMTFGRPNMIHGPSTIPLPLNVDDEYLTAAGIGCQPHDKPSYLSLFVNSCQLLDILQAVLHFITAHEPGAERTNEESAVIGSSRILAQVLEINRRLDQFSMALPSYLRMSESEIESLHYTNELGFQKKVLYCRFLLTRLLLLRPLLLSTMVSTAEASIGACLNETLDDGVIRQCCQLCVSTAYNLIDTIYVNLGTIYRSSSWHSVYFTFSSAIVLLASLKTNTLNIRASDISFQIHWTRCLAIMDCHKEQVASAGHVIRLLKTVQQRLFKPTQSDQSQVELVPRGGIGPATTVPQMGIEDAPVFGEGSSFLDGNFEDCFGTNFTNLYWLEMFQSEI